MNEVSRIKFLTSQLTFDALFTGLLVKLFTLQEQKFDINGLVFSLDDRFLLTGSVDTTIKVWDMMTGQVVRTFTMPPP